MANLAEIKMELGVQTLPLRQVKTEAGEKTAWFRKWDPNTRIAILVHQEVLNDIKADAGLNTLHISTKIKQGAQGEYTAKYICIGDPADETL